MAKYRPMKEEESLRRSHSGLSNFKLTLVCLLCSLSVFVFVAALATVGTGMLSAPVLTAVCVISGITVLLSLVLIARFKR